MGECVELFKINETMGNVVVSVVGNSRHNRDSLILTNTSVQQSSTMASGYGSISDIAWSFLDDTVITVMDNGNIGMFPILESDLEPSIIRGVEPMSDVSSARTMPLFATGLCHGEVQFWDIRSTKNPIASCPQMKCEFNQMSFSPDDLYFQSSMEDSSVYVFDIRMLNKPLRVFVHDYYEDTERQPQDSVGVTMSRWTKQDFLFSCGGGGTCKVWDLRRAGSDALLKTVRAHCFSVSCIDVSPDGMTIASGCDGNRVALHSIAYEDPVLPPITAHCDPLASLFGPLKLP